METRDALEEEICVACETGYGRVDDGQCFKILTDDATKCEKGFEVTQGTDGEETKCDCPGITVSTLTEDPEGKKLSLDTQCITETTADEFTTYKDCSYIMITK